MSDPILRLHAPGSLGERNLISPIASHDRRCLAGVWLEQNIPEQTNGASCRLELRHHPESASRFPLSDGGVEVIVFSDRSVAIATGNREGMEILPIAFSLARERKLGDGRRLKFDVRPDILGKIQVVARLLEDGEKIATSTLFSPAAPSCLELKAASEKIEAEAISLASRIGDLPDVAVRPFEALSQNASIPDGSFIPSWMSVEAPEQAVTELQATQKRVIEALRCWLFLRGFSGRFSTPSHYAGMLLEEAPRASQPLWDAPGSLARKEGNPFRTFLRLFPDLKLPLVHTQAFHRQWRYDRGGKWRTNYPVSFYPRAVSRKNIYTPHAILEATCLLGPVAADDERITDLAMRLLRPM